MKFKVIIAYDSEYGGYVVDVPALVGCMSQGKTLDEALNNIQRRNQGMVRGRKKLGRFKVIEERDLFRGEVTVDELLEFKRRFFPELCIS